MTSQQQDLRPPAYRLQNACPAYSLSWSQFFSQVKSFIFEAGPEAMASLSEKSDQGISDLAMPAARIRPVYFWKKKRNSGKNGRGELTPTAAEPVSPHSGDKGQPVPDPGPRGSWPDLLAFVAVLTTGLLLVLLGHVPTSELTAICAALGGLYAAWRGFRKPPRQ